jgi:Rha family phage regulatory protein
MNELVVRNHTGEPVTTSLLVAEKFGKEHKHVLESIRNLTAENSAVLSMFAESSYLNVQNKEQPMFIMNRDGFALLVMGFTGQKALDFKIAFIEAFNRLEEQGRMFQMNAEMIRGIVREELRGAVTPPAPGGTVGATAASTTNAQPRFKPCKDLTVKDDDEAKRFFGSVEGSPASKETMYANACVLNAIRERMIAETGKATRQRGGFMYFSQMGRALDEVWAAGWRHNLPTNARRLSGRFHAYMDGGYRSLVTGYIGNRNARKF